MCGILPQLPVVADLSMNCQAEENNIDAFFASKHIFYVLIVGKNRGFWEIIFPCGKNFFG